MSSRKQIKQSALITTVLLCGLSAQVCAESRTGNVTYSPEHWPDRWSSAIRQQQNSGRYPTRKKPEAPRPKERETVSEDDLFYLPSARRTRDFDHRADRFDDHMSRQRYYRDAQRMSRESAYAYHDVYPAYPYAGFGGGAYGGFGGFPYGTAPMGIDPVLGHPGMGIPIMPGVPYGYPYAGYPGAWGGYSPLGVW